MSLASCPQQAHCQRSRVTQADTQVIANTQCSAMPASIHTCINVGRQSTGSIAAFLRPLPPAQPEAEAKAMAASLAATAAANAQQQKHAVHAVVQVCVKPEQKTGEGRALPKLQRPFLMCPVDMQIGQLQKVSKLFLSTVIKLSVQLRQATCPFGQLPVYNTSLSFVFGVFCVQAVCFWLQQPFVCHMPKRHQLLGRSSQCHSP